MVVPGCITSTPVHMLVLTITAGFSFLEQLGLPLDVLDQIFPREGIKLEQHNGRSSALAHRKWQS